MKVKLELIDVGGEIESHRVNERLEMVELELT